MNSLEVTLVEWLGHGWLLLLAFTAAVLVVAGLRKPCRSLFGTERAFQLWLLPPLAMLASQLPHAAATNLTTLPTVIYMITSIGQALPTHGGVTTGMNWRLGAVSIWLAGVLVSLAFAAWAQWRYRRHLRNATLITSIASRWPVLRATRVDIGPALVGAWRSRIVLPADFERRYDADEQALILSHETIHARRHDGWWCLLTRIVVAMFWFHPLAWWAFSALRHDQELACDAAVLRQHREQRSSYAHAMLKTQSALCALPIGCPWSPRHPLTERIAMLKLSSPSRVRRSTGMLVGLALATIMAGSVYAASKPLGGRAAAATQAHEYELSMMINLSSDDAHASHAIRTTLALCSFPGRSTAVVVHGWKFDTTTMPESKGHVRINLAVSSADGKPVAHTHLLGALGESLHTEGNGDDGIHHYAVDVTPLAGCPARIANDGSSARLHLISQVAKNESARAVAVAVAAKAGLTLINPDALDNSLVTLNFDQIPAERAMHLIADIDGKKAVFKGSEVRFEAK